MSDELILEARGRRISGWTSASATLSCIDFPNQFDVEMTWRDPVTKGAVIAAAGDEFKVSLGDDVVITGYLDEDVGGGDARSRTLRLTGRGKTQDLVDCSAEWKSDQLIGGNALTICQGLCKPYGIGVSLANGAEAGPDVTSWALNFVETPAQIIQRVAQNAQLIPYEDAQGQLVLAKVGSKRAASGVAYGTNVERWAVQHSMHERYSEVLCSALPTETLGDLNGNLFFAKKTDPNVKRHRRLVIVLEEVAEDPQKFTERKAAWIISHSAGRSLAVTATVDTWRDKDKKLWTPNTLVPVSLPDNRLPDQDLVLTSVTFRRDESGTHADLTLMPPAALTPEPINLLPTNTADLKAAST